VTRPEERWLGAALLAGYALAWWFTFHLVAQPDLPDPCRAEQAATFDPVAAWTEMDADVLAAVAKVEDPEAGAAVMWTVVNRDGGHDLAAAAARPHQYAPWLGRRWRHRLDRAQLADLRYLALRVLAGEVPDPTRGATHFHRRGTWTPPWAPHRRAWRDFGSHHFYKEKRT